jgi:hypothetical protein
MVDAGGEGRPFREEATEFAERNAAWLKTVAEEIERRRSEFEGRGGNFTALTFGQLERKMKRTSSPMIVYQGWGGSGPAGGSMYYSAGISNPDPTDQIWLFGHVFIGPATTAPDFSESLTAVDPRFPRISMPAFPGLTVKAGATEQLDFVIEIPLTVEKSNYLGNLVLFQSTWHDPSVPLDRSLFVFAVT